MMKILVFGNPIVKKDSLALRIMPQLMKIFSNVEFKEIDPTEDLRNEGRVLNIIDVAHPNFTETSELVLDSDQSFSMLENNKVLSMHDFDLAYNLKLFKKLGFIDRVNIICIPNNLSEDKALDQSQLILRKWVAQDMQGS